MSPILSERKKIDDREVVELGYDNKVLMNLSAINFYLPQLMML